MDVCRHNPDTNSLYYECPGCGHGHSVDAKRWNWNGDTQKPTLSPSVRHFIPAQYHPSGKDKTTCHYFLRNGKIQFCADSGHALKGQTVDLPAIE